MARPIGRPPPPRRQPRFAYVLVGFAVLLVAGYVILPPILQSADGDVAAMVDELRRRISPRYVLLEERAVSASSSTDEHPISLAFDGATNTYWSTNQTSATINVEIDGTAHIGAIVLHGGVRGQPDAFRTPASLRIVSLDTGATVTLDLLPGVERQDHVFDLPVTGRLEIAIVTSRGDSSLPLAISELELNAVE